MKYFGEDWGAPVCEHSEQIPIPDVDCYLCKKHLTEGDQGVVMPFNGPYPEVPSINHPDGSCEVACHLDCFLGSIKGQE